MAESLDLVAPGLGQIRYMGGIGRGGSGPVVCAVGEAARGIVPPPFLRRKDNGNP